MTDEPTQEQPIPVEEIKAFYVDQLELRVDQAEIEKAQAALAARAEAAQKRFAKLFADRGLDPQAFTVNLKSGKLTPAPARGQVEPPPPDEPPAKGRTPEP